MNFFDACGARLTNTLDLMNLGGRFRILVPEDSCQLNPEDTQNTTLLLYHVCYRHGRLDGRDIHVQRDHGTHTYTTLSRGPPSYVCIRNSVQRRF